MPDGLPYGGARACDVVSYGLAGVHRWPKRRGLQSSGRDADDTRRLFAT